MTNPLYAICCAHLAPRHGASASVWTAQLRIRSYRCPHCGIGVRVDFVAAPDGRTPMPTAIILTVPGVAR